MKDKNRKYGIILLVFILVFSVGCTNRKKSPGISLESGSVSTQSSNTSGEALQTGSIYEHDTSAMVLSLNHEKKEIHLLNLLEGEELSLTWSGGTKVFSEYDNTIAMSQIEDGELAEIRYDVKNNTLVSLRISKDAWEYTGVTNYTWDNENEMFVVGDRKYRYDSRLRLFSDGEDFEISSLVDGDSFTMRGYDNFVYSIVLDKGHGYVQLENDDYFLGGWIEIGNKVMRVITEDMLLVVPEGTYTMAVSNHGVVGKEEITIEKDKELTINVSKYEGEPPQNGTVRFEITPEEAALYINGGLVNQDEEQSLDYGVYRITLKADGYETMSRTLIVHSEDAVISMDMTRQNVSTSTEDAVSAQETNENNASSQTDNTNTSNNTSNVPVNNTSNSGTTSQRGNFSTETVPETNDAANAEYVAGSDENGISLDTNEVQTISGYKIYVKEPKDTIVFFDGNYVGTVPVGFTKKSGIHTVTLKKSGCETKTYTVNINADNEDLFLSYSELEAEKSE